MVHRWSLIAVGYAIDARKRHTCAQPPMYSSASPNRRQFLKGGREVGSQLRLSSRTRPPNLLLSTRSPIQVAVPGSNVCSRSALISGRGCALRSIASRAFMVPPAGRPRLKGTTWATHLVSVVRITGCCRLRPRNKFLNSVVERLILRLASKLDP
jgi:hypothetical protein